MSKPSDLEISTLKQMLGEIGELAEQSSLTGAFSTGAHRLIKHYNFILETLKEKDLPQCKMFDELDDNSDFGAIAVESRMLLAAVGDKRSRRRDREDEGLDWLCGIAPFLDSADFEVLLLEKLDHGFSIPDEMLPAIAPFVGSGVLGRIVRSRIAKPKAPEPPVAPVEPVVAPREASMVPVPEPQFRTQAPANSVEELQNILSRLADSGLDREDKEKVEGTIAKVLRELGSRL